MPMHSSDPAHPGTVYLVGAGPGDPGLLTVAGAQALGRADVVIYDYLANRRLLELAPHAAEKIYVGKTAGQHTLTQDQINDLLVDAAGRARVVVRLKGGDPYVFGRGGEEAAHLHGEHVPYVVIPGITAGIAAPAYAGIPVTHRAFATTVTFVTGHEKAGSDAESSRVDFAALAGLGKTGTLCFYMGVKALPDISAKLITAGLPATTPAAVIRWGTHPHQQTVAATLATIAAEVARAQLTAPALTIIGEVVALRASLNWFETRPLFGKTVLVTRTREQASALAAQLTELGACVLEAPTIELAAAVDQTLIDDALQHMPAYDWVVFTSANGVRAAWQRLRQLGFDARQFAACEIAAVGPATAEALEQVGLTADLVADKYVGEALAQTLRESVPDIDQKRFLLLRAQLARPALCEELRRAGAVVDDVPLYATVAPRSLPEDVLEALRAGKIDAVTFTSSSTVKNLHALLPADLHEALLQATRISIGPMTSQALSELGWPATAEADPHDISGVIQATLGALSPHPCQDK